MGRVSDARARLMRAGSELIWMGSFGATTVDQICARAGVQKGSFYHFFKSKLDLACAAIDAGWAQYRVILDGVFSPAVDPLDRLRRYCDHELAYQVEMKRKFGMVMGCPYCTLGTEISRREDRLRRKLDDIMRTEVRYIESAIRDAQARKLVKAVDAAATARIVFAYIEGLLSLARIRNDLGTLRGMKRNVLGIVGIKRK